MFLFSESNCEFWITHEFGKLVPSPKNEKKKRGNSKRNSEVAGGPEQGKKEA